jgi:hypothetical protein
MTWMKRQPEMRNEFEGKELSFHLNDDGEFCFYGESEGIKNWTRLARITSRFQDQVAKLRESVPNEVVEWRKTHDWSQRRAWSIKCTPKQENEDLQAMQDALWTQEMWRHEIEEKLEIYNLNEKAHLTHAVRTRNLTMDALWDEFFAMKNRNSERMKDIWYELNTRPDGLSQDDIDKSSAEQCEQKKQSQIMWMQKYHKFRDDYPGTWRWAESTVEALNKRLTDIGSPEDPQREGEP